MMTPCKNNGKGSSEAKIFLKILSKGKILHFIFETFVDVFPLKKLFLTCLKSCQINQGLKV